jgi:hypothetical protein
MCASHETILTIRSLGCSHNSSENVAFLHVNKRVKLDQKVHIRRRGIIKTVQQLLSPHFFVVSSNAQHLTNSLLAGCHIAPESVKALAGCLQLSTATRRMPMCGKMLSRAVIGILVNPGVNPGAH